MRKCAFFWLVLAILAFQVGVPANAQAADVVGRLTQVEGRVDLLRGGKLPAIPVTLNDGVQVGDVLRTKSMSKAQITFTDNSTMTISPESRVGIETYMFDSSKDKRNSVVQLFQGLADVAVSKIFKAAEPDFVVKTQTAIMGARGTDFGVLTDPNSSDVLNFEGLLQVGNILPEVSQLFRRAFKVAYSFSTGGAKWAALGVLEGYAGHHGGPGSASQCGFCRHPRHEDFLHGYVQYFGQPGSRWRRRPSPRASALVAAVPPWGNAAPGSGFLGINQPGTGGDHSP